MAALLVLSTLMVAGIDAGPAAAEGPAHTWEASGEQYVPRTDGEWIVWIDGRETADYSGEYEVFAARMDDGQEFVIAPGLERRAYA